MLSDGDGLTGEVRVVGDQTISIHLSSAFKMKGKAAWHSLWHLARSLVQRNRSAGNAMRRADLSGSGVNLNVIQKKAERTRTRLRSRRPWRTAVMRLTPSGDMFMPGWPMGRSARDGTLNCAAPSRKTLPKGAKPARSITEHDGAGPTTMVARRVNWVCLRWNGMEWNGPDLTGMDTHRNIDRRRRPRHERRWPVSARVVLRPPSAVRPSWPSGSGPERCAASASPLPRPGKMWTWRALLRTILIENAWRPMARSAGHRVQFVDFSLRQFQALKAPHRTSPHRFPPARNHAKDTYIDVKTASKQVGDRTDPVQDPQGLRHAAPTITRYPSRAAATVSGRSTTCAVPESTRCRRWVSCLISSTAARTTEMAGKAGCGGNLPAPHEFADE